MQASPLSELYIKECEFKICSKTGTYYKIEPNWIDTLIIHWDMLKMNGITPCTLSFEDHLSFFETIPMKEGVTLHLKMTDTQKNKVEYMFIMTDVSIESRAKRKRVTSIWLDPMSYNLTKMFTSHGFKDSTTATIINFMTSNKEFSQLTDKINGLHAFNNKFNMSNKDEYYKSHSYVLSGNKSVFRNIKDKLFEEGLFQYNSRTKRNIGFIKNIFDNKKPRKNIYTITQSNPDYYYQIQDITKVNTEVIDLAEPGLKRDWFSQFSSQPQKIDIDFTKLELDFDFNKKMKHKVNYYGIASNKTSRENDISPEGKLLHIYLDKILQRNVIKIVIYGDFTLDLGDIIETKLYSIGGKIDEIDQEMSGLWIVTEIQDTIHIPSFFQIVTLSRPRNAKNLPKKTKKI